MAGDDGFSREPLPFGFISQFTEQWQAPTFQNTWVDFDPTTYNAAGYWRDREGAVRLRGLIKKPTAGVAGETMVVLPVGYRPSRTEIFAVLSASALGEVRITAGGLVQFFAGSNAWVTLDGLTFRAANWG